MSEYLEIGKQSQSLAKHLNVNFHFPKDNI